MFTENIKKVLFFTLLILTSVVIVWQSDETTSGLDDNDITKNEPDYFIINGTYTLFSDSGEVSLIMRSQEAKHYPNNDAAILTKPNLLLYRQENIPWRVTADDGEYNLTSEILDLNNNVVIVRDERLTTPWTLTTESLTLHSKTRFITTKQPVTISDHISVMNGIGMNAWVDKKKVELTSNVRGEYVQDTKTTK